LDEAVQEERALAHASAIAAFLHDERWQLQLADHAPFSSKSLATRLQASLIRYYLVRLSRTGNRPWMRWREDGAQSAESPWHPRGSTERAPDSCYWGRCTRGRGRPGSLLVASGLDEFGGQLLLYGLAYADGIAAEAGGFVHG
jgi:hypothetical protein